MDTHAADLFANRPPYLKERVVMVKHLLKSANQKAKHREWRECLLVVGQGELKMYGLQSDGNNYSGSSSTRRNMIRASSASFANLADSFSKNHSSSFANNNSMMNLSTSFGGEPQGDNQRWAVGNTYKPLDSIFIYANHKCICRVGILTANWLYTIKSHSRKCLTSARL